LDSELTECSNCLDEMWGFCTAKREGSSYYLDILYAS